MPDQIVKNVIEALEALYVAICRSTIKIHECNLSNLSPLLILYVWETMVLLIKTKNPAKGDKVNMVVLTLGLSMYLISVILVEVGGMELS